MSTELTKPASDALNWLCARSPGIATATVETEDLRTLMLRTGGSVLAMGRSYDIEAKSLGAGVYRLRLIKPAR